MRFVHISVPTGKQSAIFEILDDEAIDYVVSEESRSESISAVVSFPLAPEDVEPTLERLRAVGITREAWTVVLSAQTVLSDRIERETTDGTDCGLPGRIAREELRTAAIDLAPQRSERWSYVAMTVVSAVVATVGLLQNSAAVVVGSMVIAPLIGPAMATAVGTVVDDRKLAARGVALQVGGLLLAVLSAAVFAAALRAIGIVPPATSITSIPEIQSRLAPDFLSLAVAIGAGVSPVR
ncbi:DUF389 domain-containing protein [Halomarina rubra]